MTNRKVHILIFLVIIICFTFLGFTYKQTRKMDSSTLLPRTTKVPDAVNDNTPQAIADLSAIVYALEKYKQEHRRYPISSDGGKGWDGIISAYGESKVDWIEGLAPKYIERLPRDPRMSSSGEQQYLYKSDGANYKLIAHKVDDCEKIKALSSDLIDPKRNCFAYGFWTRRAFQW